jgi:beta-lactamase superfamily II metal-dependent hydrolase
MYNVGFGDCFLLFVPTEKGERTILIDCGTIKAARHTIKEVVAAVIRDLRQENKRQRVDLLIATHRHKDHILGFGDERWREVSVGEVWMPWTEDPRDPEAAALRTTQARFALALQNALRVRSFRRRSALLEIVMNALSNESALDMLHSGFYGRPARRYLAYDPKAPEVLSPAAIPGLDVHVLGPSRSKVVLKQMNPAKGEAYLAALEYEAGGDDGDPETFAFGTDWAIVVDDASRRLDAENRLSRADIKSVEAHAAERDWELLAATADQAINNTSLILVLRIGATHLLFPGDAQWGPWQLLFSDPAAAQLLSKTAFYKISHHGSQNATPPAFVELMKSGNGRARRLVSMLSVTEHKRFDDVPRAPLVAAIEKASKRLVRSDMITKANEHGGSLWAEVALPV